MPTVKDSRRICLTAGRNVPVRILKQELEVLAHTVQSV
jgi:hypothetical protein